MALVHNARHAKLQIDYGDLMQLPTRSDLVTVEPIDQQPGWPPERYVITFTCEGIARIDASGKPEKSAFHQVELYLWSHYPVAEPQLRWLTDIWHPNIDSKEPRHVCTNAVESYHSSRPLSELVRRLGQMVQYQRYHAAHAYPFPLNTAAAKWVREVGEPQGWVSKDRPIDPRPLIRPSLIRAAKQGARESAATAAPVTPPATTSGVQLGRRREPASAASGSGSGVVLGTRR
jgi:ubiquitin-protein ligase